MKRPRTHAFVPLPALLVWWVLGFVWGCDSAQLDSASCPEQACEQGRMCMQGTCVSQQADPDDDGLSIATELAAGLDPLSPDSDLDGIPDGIEWGAGKEPRDRDLDGIPDALENQDLDEDGDCVPDVWDANSQLATPPPAGWIAMVCSSKGVCSEEGALLELVCAGGVAHCVVKAVADHQAFETLCDGRDNDCDGQADEGIWLGSSALGGVCWSPGICGAGQVQCDSQTLSPFCSSMALAQPEVCDGKDDNCDGVIDDGITLDGVALGETCEGVGECGQGVVVCAPSAQVPVCSTMPGSADSLASEETCDGRDNDCDGYIDEELVPPAVKECPTKGVCSVPWSQPSLACVEGQWVCVFAGVESYEPGYERTCDSLDNDCDGSVDEDFALAGPVGALFLGQACGVGPCNGGVVNCASDGNGVVCSTALNATPEVCDGADNDCDGVADNGLSYQGRLVGEPCVGTGLCGPGLVICTQEQQIACSSNPGSPDSEATLEICDLRDNDCDGSVDEELGTGPECVAPGVCQSATYASVCLQGRWQCDYSGVTSFQIAETSCDGLDNDCDGAVDEETQASFLVAQAALVSDAPAHRERSASAVMGDALWLFGGAATALDGTGLCLSDWWKHESSGTWTALENPSISGRYDAGMVVWPKGNGALIVGGQCDGVITQDAWLLSDQQIQPVALPVEVTSRYGHSLFLESEMGQLLVVGGKRADGSFADSWACSGEWQCQGPLPGFPLVSRAASCLDPLANRAFLFGGWNEDGTLGAALVQIDLPSRQVVSMDWVGGPEARSGAALACQGDAVWLAGGVNQSGELLSDVWSFSVANQKWSSQPDLPDVAQGGVLRNTPTGWVLKAQVDAAGRMDHSGIRLEPGQTQWVANGSVVPGVGAGASMAHDRFRDRVCVTGGLESTSQAPIASGTVWCRVGDQAWRAENHLEHPLVDGVMAYDPYQDRYLVLGGRDPQNLDPNAALSCRAEWFRPGLPLEHGTLPWCQAQQGPGAFTGAFAALEFAELRLWVLLPASETTDMTLWELDLQTEIWTAFEVPAEVLGLEVTGSVWQDDLGWLWVLVDSPDGLEAVAWEPGAMDLASRVEVGSQTHQAALLLEQTSGELLVLGRSPQDSFVALTHGAGFLGPIPEAAIPSSFIGDWGQALWSLAWTSATHRQAEALGRTTPDGLTQPSELRIQMRCN